MTEERPLRERLVDRRVLSTEVVTRPEWLLLRECLKREPSWPRGELLEELLVAVLADLRDAGLITVEDLDAPRHPVLGRHRLSERGRRVAEDIQRASEAARSNDDDDDAANGPSREGDKH